MSIDGWYYLHTNGDLIYKRELGETAGVNTDWPALQARIAESLLRQHKVMYPHGDAI